LGHDAAVLLNDIKYSEAWVFVYFEDLGKLMARIMVSPNAPDWPNVPAAGRLSQRSLRDFVTKSSVQCAEI